MRSEIAFVLAAAAGFVLAVLLALLLWRPALNLWADSFLRRLFKDRYPENVAEMYNVIAKVGVQNIIETGLRATNGEPLQRPFGTPRHLSHWEDLLLNPVYLSRQPLVEAAKVDTSVILGPKAKRPLVIGLPILLGGMGYGIGLSRRAKIALAKGADVVDTAANTGAGPFLPDERQHVKRLIVQYHRGAWGKDEEILRQADAVEIQLGYGALGSAPVRIAPPEISDELRDYLDVPSGESLHLAATLPNVHDGAELADLVGYLRRLTNGAPVGAKFGATNHLEAELDIFLAAGVDFISLDGAEAGINYGPGILADDVGLPTLPALCRAARHLRVRGQRDRISLIVSGGLVTPGQFLKSIALGADAVAIGTIALLALTHTQMTKVIPWEPPTELIYESGKARHLLDVDAGARSVANFLQSCRDEVVLAMRAMGRASFGELSAADLCALTPETAAMTGTALALYPPEGETANV